MLVNSLDKKVLFPFVLLAYTKHVKNKSKVFTLKLVYKIVEPATLNKFTSLFLKNLFGDYCLVKMYVESMTIRFRSLKFV